MKVILHISQNRISLPLFNKTRQKMTLTYQGTETDELDISSTRPKLKLQVDPKIMVQ